jgi:virginiamycin B lyase
VDQEFPLDEQALAKAMYVEYYLPMDPVLDKDNKQRRAQEPWIGEDGVVWYTDRSIPNRVGYVDPRTAVFKDYVLPNPKGDPHGLMTDGMGNLFWAETVGLHLGRLDIKTGKMTRYSMDPNNEIPGGQGHTPVMDSKKNIWFTVIIGNRIGVWDRKTEKIKTWPVPTYNSFPYGIVLDKDDNVWFAEFHGCKIAKFDPRTEKFTEYPAAILNKEPKGCLIRRLGLDDKVGQVFYGVYSHGTIGQIDIKTGETIETPVPMPFGEPYDTWADGKGNAWVSDGGQGGALILFNLKTRDMTYYPTPQITDQPKLDISRDGGVWYSPRSSTKAAVGVLYPDVTKITRLGAYR